MKAFCVFVLSGRPKPKGPRWRAEASFLIGNEMQSIEIQPMEDWLKDRIELLREKIEFDLEEDNEIDEELVEEKNFLDTILEKLTEE